MDNTENTENVNIKVLAKTPSICKHINPMEENIWSVGAFSAEHVLSADDFFIQSHLGHQDYASVDWDIANTKEYNIARVAWLMRRRHSFDEDYSPITFYFCTTLAGKTCFEVVDGNHRLSAAIARGDKAVPVLLEINPKDAGREEMNLYVEEVLGVRCGSVI